MDYPAQEHIRWRDVVSSNVRKVGWDKEGNMYVLFEATHPPTDRNTLYMYRDVPRQRVIAAARAKSVGQYIHRNIKPFFEAVRIR